LDDGLGGDSGHASVVGNADGFLAGAAVNVDAEDAAAFVRSVAVCRRGWAHDANRGDVQRDGDVARAAVVADEEVEQGDGGFEGVDAVAGAVEGDKCVFRGVEYGVASGFFAGAGEEYTLCVDALGEGIGDLGEAVGGPEFAGAERGAGRDADVRARGIKTGLQGLDSGAVCGELEAEAVVGAAEGRNEVDVFAGHVDGCDYAVFAVGRHGVGEQERAAVSSVANAPA